MKIKYTAIISILFLIGFTGIAYAQDVGSMIAIRGKAIIERDNKAIEAKIKDRIELKDTIETKQRSKAKMLFIDDSVLTLGEKSKVVIKEFVYSKGRGSSIFNLLDGKMRSIVGKTGFQVETPTAVAAARGTVILFHVGVMDGRKFTTIICLEGMVDVRNIDPKVMGSVTLKPGQMTIVWEGEPPTQPEPATGDLTDRLLRDTDTGFYELSIPGPMQIGVGQGWMEIEPPIGTPPIEQQPGANTTPVTIHPVFPQ